MSLVPRLLRPSALIRRKAMYAGFLGNSTFWKIVGVFVFGKSSLKKFFGKNPEVIDVSSLGSGRMMEIRTSKPVTRRRRRKLARQGVPVPTLDAERARGRAWAAKHAARRAS